MDESKREALYADEIWEHVEEESHECRLVDRFYL
jgi:hypothetical protein